MSAPVIAYTEKYNLFLMVDMADLSGHSSEVIIGVFAVSIIFVVSAADFVIWARRALFTLSMLFGMTSAEFIASLLSSLLDNVGDDTCPVFSDRNIVYLRGNNELFCFQ